MVNISDAIRIGSKIRPQQFGGFYGARTREGTILGLAEDRVTSCALGAAFEAVHLKREPVRTSGPWVGRNVTDAINLSEPAYVLPEAWNWILRQTTACPVCKIEFLAVNLISHMNDDHKLSREAIADFVETVESAPVLMWTAE